jgi:ATP synthase protein I
MYTPELLRYGNQTVQDVPKKKAKRTILAQIVLFFVCALLALIFISTQAAYSIVLGGLATVIPAFIFMFFALAHQGAQQAARILGDFYLGVFFKFLSMGLLFYVFFKFCHLNGLFFMLSFIMTQIFALIAPRLLSVYDRRTV